MQEHFLSCLHFVPSHNTWNLNASISVQVLLCFTGKHYSPPQKPTISTKPQVVSSQKMGGKAILSDAWARRSANKCCSITQNELNAKAGRMSAECRQLRIGTGLSSLCNCYKMFPLHSSGKGQ